jgi:uncharacterized protein (DUF1697 family)
MLEEVRRPVRAILRAMTVMISMLRGVNVGSHQRIKMDALRAVYESLKLEQVRTFIQSGNIIFRTKEKNLPALAKKIQAAIKAEFGFGPEVVLRTADELRQAVAANPFAKRRDLEPAKLLITFLAAEPAPEAHSNLLGLKSHPEELHLKGRELYIYFPNGMGKTKLLWSSVEKLLKTTGTARNLNSAVKMLAIAEGIEAAG